MATADSPTATKRLLAVCDILKSEAAECVDVRVMLLQKIVALPPDEWWAIAHLELADVELSMGRAAEAATHASATLTNAANVSDVTQARAVIVLATANQDRERPVEVQSLEVAVACARDAQADCVIIGLHILAFEHLFHNAVEQGRAEISEHVLLTIKRFGAGSVDEAVAWRTAAFFEWKAGERARALQHIERGLACSALQHSGSGAAARSSLEKLRARIG